MSDHDSIRAVTADIVAWADATFPDRTPQSAFIKFFKEIGELTENPRSPGEYADVCVLIFDLAHMHGVDLAQALEDKIKINKGRTWIKEELGTYRHVKADNESD